MHRRLNARKRDATFRAEAARVTDRFRVDLPMIPVAYYMPFVVVPAQSNDITSTTAIYFVCHYQLFHHILSAPNRFSIFTEWITHLQNWQSA
jgi:hypothetical protein